MDVFAASNSWVSGVPMTLTVFDRRPCSTGIQIVCFFHLGGPRRCTPVNPDSLGPRIPIVWRICGL